MKEKEILSLFHHIHHFDNKHEVHHCGGEHAKIDPKVDYRIKHCNCGKHSIDKQIATGHATGSDLNSFEVKIEFKEVCPGGGWHLESGIKLK